MHLHAVILCLATALPLAWSVPEYFFLQSKSTTAAFNDLYLTETDPPSFTKLNANAYTYNLLAAPKTSASAPQLYYFGYNQTSYNTGLRAELNFNSAPFASWEPLAFVSAKQASAATFENRFTINGTGSNAQLVWKNDPKSQYQFGGWLICNWSYLVPQLFFFTGPAPKNLPSICAPATLSVIPVPNAS